MEYASKKNGSNKIFSEQNLIDCDTNSFGCSGGDIGMGLIYVNLHGIAESAAYKYVQKTGTCKAATIPPVYFLPNVAFWQKGDESTLLLALMRHGPVGVAISKTCSYV